LLTNGKRLSDEAYLDTLSQAGLDHILVALIEGDPASKKGLVNAIASDIYTAVHLTITPENVGKTRAALEEVAQIGVSAVSLSSNETTKTMSEVLSEAREYAADLGLDIIWNLPVPYSAINPIALELDVPPVGAGRAWLYVEPDGDVLPTQGLNQVLGNLLRDSWPEIWVRAQG
jgi:MoaA/NifB/PqqE/SkfB family radical SAM enzyme